MPIEASVGTKPKGVLNQGDCDHRSQEKVACQNLFRKENAQRLRFPRESWNQRTGEWAGGSGEE